MDCRSKIKELRESTGMNRKEFCKYFQIPYRTVTEWELDNRHAPEYVLRLLEYYIRNEGLMKEPISEECPADPTVMRIRPGCISRGKVTHLLPFSKIILVRNIMVNNH